MNFIKLAVNKLITWANTATYAPKVVYDDTKSSDRYMGDLSRGMNFVLYPASGGTVVQIYSKDMLSDRRVSTLYVIHDTDDLGKELGEIVTREGLSR